MSEPQAATESPSHNPSGDAIQLRAAGPLEKILIGVLIFVLTGAIAAQAANYSADIQTRTEVAQIKEQLRARDLTDREGADRARDQSERLARIESKLEGVADRLTRIEREVSRSQRER